MKFWLYIISTLFLSCSYNEEKAFVIENVSKNYEKLLISKSQIYSTFYVTIYGEVDGEFEIELLTPENPKAMYVEKKTFKSGKLINVGISTDLFHNYDVLFKYRPINVANGHLRIVWRGY